MCTRFGTFGAETRSTCVFNTSYTPCVWIEFSAARRVVLLLVHFEAHNFALSSPTHVIPIFGAGFRIAVHVRHTPIQPF